MSAKRRGSIHLESAGIIEHVAYAGDQYVLRLHAPLTAAAAEPGNFAHIRCDDAVPLRRPLSIMRADRRAGWVEFLYKPVGHGLTALASKAPGEELSLLAPIGNRFELDDERPRVIAIGGGVGIPPMIFLADRLRMDRKREPVVLMGSEVPFAFSTQVSALMLEGAPADATHAASLLEEWNVVSRLASLAGIEGAHAGYVPALADAVIAALPQDERDRTVIVGCGPQPMLRATASLAAKYGLPCQLALEEYMACGVGGCAGCTVLVSTPDGPAMKRVCVDGPVFDSRAVYPA